VPADPSRHSRDWNCPLCSYDKQIVAVCGPDYEYASTPGLFSLARCLRCGHVSLDPIPPLEDVLGFYPSTYYTVNPDSPLYLNGFIYETKIRRDVERIRKYMDLGRLQSIVDIGGGDAARLFELRKFVPHDTQCIGFDFRFPHTIVERAKAARIGLIEGNIETDLDMLKDSTHNLIIMSQILEHLRDPVRALKRLRTKLAPGGFLLLDTPHLGGLDYILFRRQYWGGYHLPRHLHLFKKDSLAETAKRLGYRVERQGSLPSPGFWIMSFRNALGLNSLRRGSSVFEFLNFSNLPIVGAFAGLDQICITLGMSTSNQFVLLSRD
jgi:ubiquinone/menaquinone biosynthesis C-methylase UbiE